MYLVLLETAGNQDYIFSTNKLRENIGASQLTYEAGTRFVLDAVHQLGGPDLLVLRDEFVDTAETRKKLLDATVNLPLANGGSIEVVYATSGKALLLVDTRERARSAVSAITFRALTDAPGLDLCGAVLKMDWHTDRIDKSVRSVHEELERARERRPGPRTRFLRLPVVAQCASSGLPASPSHIDTHDGRDGPLSAVSIAKRNAFPRWTARINDVLQRHDATRGRHLPGNPDVLEQRFSDLDWTAVVHCDANGLGALFLTFQDQDVIWSTNPTPADWGQNNQLYVTCLRKLSVEVEVATETAFAAAVATLPKSDLHGNWIPVVPVLLGGDDFTVMCAGRGALAFTETYLDAFESATALRDGLIEILRMNEGGRLSASGGVAITKPHFPFHLAYDLAEELTASAKVVKKEVPGTACSAMDFHVLFDSTFVDLSSIRDELLVDDSSTRLTRKPYVTTKKLTDEHATAWTAAHDVSKLKGRIDELTVRLGQDEGGLPNSQLHDLREGLFQGRAFADARMGLIRRRYDGLAALEETGGSLFALTTETLIIHDTQLLDVMETEPFWNWKE